MSATAQAASPCFCSVAAPEDTAVEDDYTSDLPKELLAIVLWLLGLGYRKRCSLVCHCWLATEASSCMCLALDARASLLTMAPAILARFSVVSKLALKCDRRMESVGDPALVLVVHRLGPGLRHLKLRSVHSMAPSEAARAYASNGATPLHLAAMPFAR